MPSSACSAHHRHLHSFPTRRSSDLVYIEELGKLVDEVPPVPFEQIRQVIGEELPPDVFVRIDPEPLATASIAQIHTALLANGRDVIRSEEHTSELQSQFHLVCRLLLAPPTTDIYTLSLHDALPISFTSRSSASSSTRSRRSPSSRSAR